MYKKPCECLYHVFSDGIDEWVKDLKEAVSIAKELRRQYGCVRIYKETDWDNVKGVFTHEDCILSFGHFPY